MHQRLRALTVLDGLIQNAGSRFQRVFADEPLLERLRVAATESVSDQEVKQKCQVLFRQWAVSYKNTPGMERIASLYKELPQRKKTATQDRSKAVKETEEEADLDSTGHSDTLSRGVDPIRSSKSPPLTPTSSSSPIPHRPSLHTQPSPFASTKKDKSSKKTKSKPFNIEKEKPQILQAIASSSVASTNLLNALKLINRENKRVSEDPEANNRFETCKVLRRQILRYIQHIESEQWLGSLIHANEELVNALMAYEILDKSIDEDSDSEDEVDSQQSGSRSRSSTTKSAPHEALAGLSIGSPPKKTVKPGFIPMPTNGRSKGFDKDEDEDEAEEEDEDDPFADRNAVGTPKVEPSGMTWYIQYRHLTCPR